MAKMKSKKVINKVFLIGFSLPFLITLCAGIIATLGEYYIKNYQACNENINNMCGFSYLPVLPFALATGPAYMIASSIGLKSSDLAMKFVYYILIGGAILGLICGSITYLISKIFKK